MRQYIYLIILAILICLSGCTWDNSLEERSAVSIQAQIAPHASTRAVVSGAAFPQNTTMGLFICKHEEGAPTAFVEYNSKYNNLYAVQTSSDVSNPVWNYRYLGTGSQFAQLFLLMPQTGEQAADFYAYAPWISGVTTPRAIPFSLTQDYRNLPDLMYASENSTDTNRNKTPDGNEIRIQYHFVHKLAWLQIKFYLRNDDGDGSLGPSSTQNSQNASTINHIVLRKRTGATVPLYGSGTFNAITGTFTDETNASTLVEADSVKVTYNYTFGTKGNTYNILLYPTELQSDGDYELLFTIDNKRLETVYPIKLADVTGSDSQVGFREGCRYTFTFTYDNYHHLYLKNTQVDDDANWTDFTQQKEIII